MPKKICFTSNRYTLMATSWNRAQLILPALKPIEEMILMSAMGTALAPKIETIAWQLANGATA